MNRQESIPLIAKWHFPFRGLSSLVQWPQPRYLQQYEAQGSAVSLFDLPYNVLKAKVIADVKFSHNRTSLALGLQ